MYYYLIAWFHVTGMTGLHFDETSYFVRHDSHDECMETAKKTIPITVKRISSRGTVYDIGFQCLPVRMLKDEYLEIPKKQCDTHMEGENCFLRLRSHSK